jgi:prophage regulatory protein
MLLAQKKVLQLVGVASRETLDRWVRQGRFPPPIRIGGGRLRWVVSEVEAWIEARKAERAPNVSAPALTPKVQGHLMPKAVAGRHHV